ncbi:TonB-dependent receptor (plasmid) [Persicobacter psychrovividus]|uniref:TonB-dependent receptor n=2 Tax=Persicobacter psychrovividus TaxID=387638 RepID=A0ABM7VJ48_9BACT|nr:TonB-dependent receptor [Persicobacter psychrovividus]
MGLQWGANAQILFKGKVLDKDQQALIGASVRVDGPQQAGQATDLNGQFSLSLQPGDYAVTLSFIGYKDQQLKLSLKENTEKNFTLESTSKALEGIIVRGSRATNTTPTTFAEIEKKTLEHANLGQDLTYLMGMSPSAVVTSDAGAGVGYTSMRIRGNDQSKINVTVNGIPLNDAESQGVFWVNMPDFASSVQSIQIQRGVGTSSNGGAAFGASVNIQTDESNDEPYGEINNSFGSFNTLKNTIKLGTGLINNRFKLDMRLSNLKSDGYIDRASSDLQSYFVQGTYNYNHHLLKFITFSGKERTYQAWYGVDQETLENDRTFNPAGALYDENWNVTGFYDDQTDNYQQTHYQLHYAYDGNRLGFNTALHYTKGQGYYQEYNQNQDYAEYGLTAPAGETTDIITRKWLDNDFYGVVFNLHYQANNQLNLTLGGGANRYEGLHFGELHWMQNTQGASPDQRYYDNKAVKDDANIFLKADYQATTKLSLFGDVQYRYINYSYYGLFKDASSTIEGQHVFNFVNPKVGATYQVNADLQAYASFAISNREPLRDDFLEGDSSETPEAESLQNLEMGVRFREGIFQGEANYYYMNYINQFVLTGEQNDVGAFIRTNSGSSYRSGIELTGKLTPADWFNWELAMTFSENKNRDYQQSEQNENEETVLVNYGKTTTSFSPATIINSQLVFTPVSGFRIGWITQFVGKQYLTNTENEALTLDAYLLNNLQTSYTFKPAWMREVTLRANINNIFNAEYVANGAVWGTTAYYYPQATANYMLGLDLKF